MPVFEGSVEVSFLQSSGGANMTENDNQKMVPVHCVTLLCLLLFSAIHDDLLYEVDQLRGQITDDGVRKRLSVCGQWKEFGLAPFKAVKDFILFLPKTLQQKKGQY